MFVIAIGCAYVSNVCSEPMLYVGLDAVAVMNTRNCLLKSTGLAEVEPFSSYYVRMTKIVANDWIDRLPVSLKLGESSAGRSLLSHDNQ